MWDPSSLTRDRAAAPCSGSVESQPPDFPLFLEHRPLSPNVIYTLESRQSHRQEMRRR